MSTRVVAHEINVHLSSISRLLSRFRESGSTSNRTRPPLPASSPPRLSKTSHLDSCCNNRFCITKEFLSQRSSSACLSSSSGLDLTAVRHRNWLKFANAHIRWHLALWRGVLFTDESWFSVYKADGRQRVWWHVGERFADVNVVDRVAHGGGGVMVLSGICDGQRTQVHFIDGILNAQWYRDEILRPIVVPFIHDHHLMLQHDNARPHVARICTQFLEAENIPILAWPAYSPNMSPIEHVWVALDRCIRQACSSSCQYPATSHSHWRGVDQNSTGHNQQHDQLYVKEMCCTALGKWWSHHILTGFRVFNIWDK